MGFDENGKEITKCFNKESFRLCFTDISGEIENENVKINSVGGYLLLK